MTGKKVIFDKQTDTINASDCHENDGKIYVYSIADMPYMLYFNEKEGYYQWVKIGGNLIKNSCLYNFRAALDNGHNVTQLSSLSELGQWLIDLNK